MTDVVVSVDPHHAGVGSYVAREGSETPGLAARGWRARGNSLGAGAGAAWLASLGGPLSPWSRWSVDFD